MIRMSFPINGPANAYYALNLLAYRCGARHSVKGLTTFSSCENGRRGENNWVTLFQLIMKLKLD